MITQKVNLLQRVRVVMIALVAVIGFGTMAMKPDVRAAHTYGVAETAGGANWEIRADVTGLQSEYNCDFNITEPACTIISDSTYSITQRIPKGSEPVSNKGDFSL